MNSPHCVKLDPVMSCLLVVLLFLQPAAHSPSPPHIDPYYNTNQTLQLGQTAEIGCRIYNVGNRYCREISPGGSKIFTGLRVGK